jgi:hypothetical protein
LAQLVVSCAFFSKKMKSLVYYTGCGVAERAPAAFLQTPNTMMLQSFQSSSDVTARTQVMDFNMCDAKVHSNLGGQGPDDGEKALRFIGVATRGDAAIDLLITTVGPYTAKNTIRNNVKGCFGVINVKSGTSADLKFSLVASGSDKPIESDGLTTHFSVVDLDQSKQGAYEFIRFQDAVDFYVTEDSTIKVSDSLGEGISCEGTFEGDGSDNPTNPLELTDSQKSKAATVEFVNTAEWRATLKAGPGKGGRNIMFTGKTSLVPPKEKSLELEFEIPDDFQALVDSAGDTKCMVKFSDFEGTTLKPNPSGKCDNCLREATKADRCFK